ncbi:MAG: NAD(P)/FAD-dependent oxidoreductase [Gammaproteobacteria bacterium]|nr:NAD(P)/FAD-dependent oxidoreductase [Gammaproteobacteria bacterium]
MSTTVIIGGGAAGLELVTRLGRQLLGNKEHQVILVEPSSYHYWKPRLHEVAAGTFDTELDAVNYAQHAACTGYRYVQARMTGLERNSKTLQLQDAQGKSFEMNYDYLVIAVGASSNDFNTPGVAEHCLFMDSSTQAQRAWDQINPLLEANSQRCITIVGAGATGVELAAELTKVSQRNKLYNRGSDIRIVLIEAAERVMPAGPVKMSRKIQRALEQQGVDVRVNTRIQRAEAGQLITADGQTINSDLQLWAAGIICADWLTELDGLETNHLNQLKVSPTLQTTKDQSIFVIGDSAECPQPDGSFVPPRAQAANQAALHLSIQFKRLLKGRALKPFVFRDGGIVIAIGHNYAVGALLNNNLILKGRLVRRLYDTVFRLHQQVLFGWGRVTSLIMLKRLKCALNPYYR